MNFQIFRMLPDELCQIALRENIKRGWLGLIGRKGIDEKYNRVNQIDQSSVYKLRQHNAACYHKKVAGSMMQKDTLKIALAYSPIGTADGLSKIKLANDINNSAYIKVRAYRKLPTNFPLI